VRHPDSGDLLVNFDAGLLQLLREARCLQRLGIELPQKVSDALHIEGKLKRIFEQVTSILSDYREAYDAVPGKARTLLHPLVNDVDDQLRPALLNLTWTSLGVDDWLPIAKHALRVLLDRSKAVGDAIENRLNAVLRTMRKAILVELPRDASFTLDEFVRVQQDSVRKVTI